MPTRPKKRTKRRTKRRRLPTIYEDGATKSPSRIPSKRRTPRRSQPTLLTKKHHSNSIKHLAIKNAQESKQLGCFGKFCKNIKSRLTRRAGRAGTRRRRGTRKKRTRKRTR